MIAVDIPFPENCSECLFYNRGITYRCKLLPSVQTSEESQPAECPIMKVHRIRTTHMLNSLEKKYIDDDQFIARYLKREAVEDCAKEAEKHGWLTEKFTKCDDDILYEAELIVVEK